MDFKIVALLPAHNEAESIAATVCALRAQTRIPDEIIVICDNCTDATAEIASDHGATVWITSGNTHKKAGALDYALERVLPQLEDDDAVLVQDADSFLDPDFVAVAAAIADGRLPDSGGGLVYSYATLTEDNWMTLALKHLGLTFVSPKNATMSTEAMLTWKDLARQRLRWKRGAFEDLLSFGLSRHTLKGWGLQFVSTLGVIATLVYLGTLMLAPWLEFHPQPWFLAFTVVYAIERAVTVKARGWKIQLLSVAVFPEWIYDLFLQSVQVRALWGAVWRTSKSW